MKSYSVFTFQKEIFDWNEQNQSITTWLHLLGFHFLFHEDGSEQRGSKYDDDSEQQSKFKDDDDSRGAWGQVKGGNSLPEAIPTTHLVSTSSCAQMWTLWTGFNAHQQCSSH